MSRRVVVIDGPSGAGKSTMARLLAETLGFQYLDTGALYRAAGLGLREKGLDENSSDEEIKETLKEMEIIFSGGRTYLNGRDVSEEIRTPEAGHWSSVFSARGPVRDFLLPVQRDASERDDLVAEGRDMGSVVFPDADIKFYLDASVEERARRRFEQLRQAGVPTDMERARQDVEARDERDSARDLAPLKKTDDAVAIDTTGLDIGQVVKRMLSNVSTSLKGGTEGK